MKKRDLISSLLVIFLYLFFSSSPVIAKQNFEFYYQTIVDVEDIRATGGTATRDAYDKTGDQRWNSKTDPNIVYTVRRIKINSRQELIDAIGVPEWKMTTGQKAMLKAYDTASSEAIEERSKYSYRDPIEVLLSDNSNADWSYTDVNGKKQNVSEYSRSKDFWSWSSGDVIHFSTENYKSSSKDIGSSFLHEYCHSIDKPQHETRMYSTGLGIDYGPDKTHYVNEISKPLISMTEGWAEYNQMMESSAMEEKIKKNSDPLMVEIPIEDANKYSLDPKLEGKECDGGWHKSKAGNSIYIYKSAKNLSAEELWNCEAYNANALYQIANSIDDGKEKIYEAFIATRENSNRDIRTFILKLCEQNPNDIAKIGRILNNLTYGKMTDDEFKKFIGDSSEAKAYLQKRAEGKDNVIGDITSAVEKGADKVGDTISNIGNGIKNGIDTVGNTVSNIGSGIKNRINNLKDKITNKSKNKTDSENKTNINEKTGSNTEDKERKVKYVVIADGKEVASGSATVSNSNFKQMISNFIKSLVNMFVKVGKTVKSSISKLVENIKSIFDNIFNSSANKETVTTPEGDNKENNDSTEPVSEETNEDNNESSPLTGTSEEEGNVFNIR